MDFEVIFDKWDSWLDIIRNEILLLSCNRYFFYEVHNNIPRSNPNIQKPSLFWTYLKITYEHSQNIIIRRQIKADKDSISIMRLISQIIDYPTILSRERYLNLIRNNSINRTVLNDQFNRFAGKGKYRDYVNPDIFKNDRRSLKEISFKSEKYADQRVAHFDSNPNFIYPTYGEMDTCINFLEELISIYFLIFRAGPIDVLPTIDSDWKKIFTVPWIVEQISTFS